MRRQPFRMIVLAALLLTAAPAVPVEMPRGVTALGSVRAEIIRAERVSALDRPADNHRTVRRETGGLVVDFN
jgi:hypothetical protein